MADVAKSIDSDREIEDAAVACPPIVFGAAGNTAEIQSGYDTLEYLEGNTESWNQLVNFNYSNTSSAVTFSGVHLEIGAGQRGIAISVAQELSYTIPAGHKLLLVTSPVSGNYTQGSAITIGTYHEESGANEWQGLISLPKNAALTAQSTIYTTTKTVNEIRLFLNNDTYNIAEKIDLYFNVFDLTLIYGAGNEPTTIAQFKSKYPLDYYSYSAPILLSSKSNSLISVEKNQYSGLNTFIRVLPGVEYELSGITAGGYIQEYDASQNLIKTSSEITATTDITLDANTYYVKILATTYSDIMFYVAYETYGEIYEPYKSHTLQLPNLELRSTVGSNIVRDIAYQTGGGLRKVGVLDLGTKTWYDYSPANHIFRADIGNKEITPSYPSPYTNAIRCAQYVVKNITGAPITRLDLDMSMCEVYNGRSIYVRNDSCNTPEDIKTAMNGVILYYPLTEASYTEITTEENPGWNQNLKIDNYGTLQFTTSPQQVPQVPQAYFIKYTVNLVEFLDSSYVKTGGDGNNIALQSDVDKIESDIQEIQDGTIVAGLADNLKSRMTLPDNSPYLFRTAGGSLEIANNCYERSIVGGTVVFNQMINTTGAANGEKNQVTFTNNGDGSWTVNGTATGGSSYHMINVPNVHYIKGHKYLLRGNKGSGSSSTFYLSDNYSGNYFHFDTGSGTIFESTINSDVNVNFFVRIFEGVALNNVKFVPQLFDLTLMLGEAIANYVYSLEVAQAGTGVAWFSQYFPKSYYSYTVRTLLSVKTTGKRVTGFNQLDLANMTELTPTGVKGLGGYISNLADNTYIGNYTASNYWNVNSSYFVSSTSNSLTMSLSAQWYSVGLVKKVLPSTSYYFNYSGVANNFGAQVAYYDASGYLLYSNNLYSPALPNATTFIHTINTPSNCHWIILSFVSNENDYGTVTVSDVNLSLKWDGERDGDVEEYKSVTYPISNVELRGVPKLDSNNSLYYDGDVYSSEGVVTRRYGVVDLGTLSWNYATGSEFFYAELAGAAYPLDATGVCNAVCSLYTIRKYGGSDGVAAIDAQDMGLAINGLDFTPPSLAIKNKSYSDAAAFKTAMSGVSLVYELATSVTESADSFVEFEQVDNWGTEELIDDRAIPLPVGHNTDYLPNLKAKVEVAPESPEADGYYVLKRNNEENVYYGLSSYLTTNNYTQKTEVALTSVGTITSTAIVSGAFFRNNIAVSGGISQGDIVFVQMSNNAVYPAINNNATQLVIFNGSDLSSLSVVKVWIVH